MRTTIAVLVLWVGTASAAVAGQGVGLFADMGQSSCIVPGDGTGVVRVHMFHMGSQLSTAVQFAVYPPPCWSGATYLGEVLAEPWLGIGATNAPMGLSIAYGACRWTPIYLGYAVYDGAMASTCCELRISKPTEVCPGCWVGSASAVELDCWLVMHAISTTNALLNANSTCPCQAPLAATPTTWGSIKSLYR